MTEQLGDAPIEPEFRAMMNELAADLDTLLNPGPQSTTRTTGFVLLVFPFDRKGRANYISNANRADVVASLKEQLARFERPRDRGEAMSDPAIIEAAARALFEVDETAALDENELARASWVVAAVTPLIRAQALEEAAQVAEEYDLPDNADPYLAGQIAADLRALKEQP